MKRVRHIADTGIKTVLILLICSGLILAAACTAASPEPEESVGTVTLTIDAHLASEAGMDGAPQDGYLLKDAPVAIDEGDTVLDVLTRAGRQENLAVSQQGSGRNAFISGIGGLTARDAKSGWVFALNGEQIQQSAGSVPASPGDAIVWHYTLDLGNDFR